MWAHVHGRHRGAWCSRAPVSDVVPQSWRRASCDAASTSISSPLTMDPTAILGTALFHLGTNLLTPAPRPPQPAVEIPPGQTFASTLAKQVHPAQLAQAPQPPQEWPEVKDALQLLAGRGPVALEVDQQGQLYVVCSDASRHFLALPPDRSESLQAFIGTSPLPQTISLQTSQGGDISGARQAALRGPAIR